MALIPPVSGGAFRLTSDPIDVDSVVAEVADERAGAIATFLGTTRIESRGRRVQHLEYEAYEGMAEKVMAEIAEALATRYELCKVAMAHRIGRVGIGETSVAIAVSAPHREHALAACKEAIDTLKVDVPALEEGGLRGRRGVDRARLVRRDGGPNGPPSSCQPPSATVGCSAVRPAERRRGSREGRLHRVLDVDSADRNAGATPCAITL